MPKVHRNILRYIVCGKYIAIIPQYIVPKCQDTSTRLRGLKSPTKSYDGTGHGKMKWIQLTFKWSYLEPFWYKCLEALVKGVMVGLTWASRAFVLISCYHLAGGCYWLRCKLKFVVLPIYFTASWQCLQIYRVSLMPVSKFLNLNIHLFVPVWQLNFFPINFIAWVLMNFHWLFNDIYQIHFLYQYTVPFQTNIAIYQ